MEGSTGDPSSSPQTSSEAQKAAEDCCLALMASREMEEAATAIFVGLDPLFWRMSGLDFVYRILHL